MVRSAWRCSAIWCCANCRAGCEGLKSEEGVMHQRLFRVAALAVLLLAPASALAQSAPPPGVWTHKKPLPGGPRNEVAITAVGGKLYVVGGHIGGTAVPMLDEYDPATDTWRARA